MRKRMKCSAIALECRYLTEDSQVKIYLISTVPVRRRRRCVFAIKQWSLKVAELMFRLLVTTSITLPLSIFLLEAVYADRGYFAIGGEYLFIGLIIFGVYSGVSNIFDGGDEV